MSLDTCLQRYPSGLRNTPIRDTASGQILDYQREPLIGGALGKVPSLHLGRAATILRTENTAETALTLDDVAPVERRLRLVAVNGVPVPQSEDCNT